MLRNIILVSIRNFLRNPATSFLNVIGLGVGFTCMLVTMMWMFTEFSFDRFHHEPDNLYKVMTHVESDGTFKTFDAASASMDISSVPEIESIVSISSGTRWPNELCFRKESNENECIYLNGIFATDRFFRTFDFSIIKGEADPLSQPKSIAISKNMAAMLYGSSEAVGKTINIDGHYPVTVTAVFDDVPANSSLEFEFVVHMNVFSAMRGLKPENFANQFFQTFIRTNQPVTKEELTTKLNDSRVLTEKLKADKLSYEAFPLENWRLKSKFEDGKNAGGRITYVNILMVIAILVVILAIINFVNMSTARATIRAKEIGIRKVTGALRSNIIRQFIGESFVIVLIAFALAALTTQLALPFFSQILNVEITIDIFKGWVPVYLLALLIFVSIIAGIYPAFVMSAFQPIQVLKNEISGIHGSKRLRKMLLVVQLSISLAILSFGGVLFLQLKYMSEKDLGIDHENIIHVEPTYRMLQKFETFKNELAKEGVILQAATAGGNPIDLQSQNTGVDWPGRAADERVSFQVTGVSQEFMETFDLKITDGNNFRTQPQDTVNTEVIVTEDAVSIMNLKDPIGAVIKIGEASCVIIGVINNFHTRPLQEERLPVILYRNQYINCSYVFVKYQSGKTDEAMTAIKKAYNTVEPSFTMKYWFQDERFDKQYKTESTASTLVLFFSTIALIIACIGIVGLATFNVLRRLKEMSIRKVFGASGIQLLSLLTKEFGWILLTSIIAGTAMVWYASDKWLDNFAYHVSMPWWLFLICTLLLAVLTIGIVVTLGMKAIVSNPTKVLRNE